MVCLALATAMLMVANLAPAQTKDAPTATSPQPKEEYEALLARVQQGDMTVDFRAFRLAAALVAGPHGSTIEATERVAFKNLLASGDYQSALNSAEKALDRNYASIVAHFDAMVACQKLNKAAEAALHEKLMNALLESVGRSGDGKSPETAWFVVTTQEEYIFLERVVGVMPKSQSLENNNGHFYDRLEAVDRRTNESRSVWFNIDTEMGRYQLPK